MEADCLVRPHGACVDLCRTVFLGHITAHLDRAAGQHNAVPLPAPSKPSGFRSPLCMDWYASSRRALARRNAVPEPTAQAVEFSYWTVWALRGVRMAPREADALRRRAGLVWHPREAEDHSSGRARRGTHKSRPLENSSAGPGALKLAT